MLRRRLSGLLIIVVLGGCDSDDPASSVDPVGEMVLAIVDGWVPPSHLPHGHVCNAVLVRPRVAVTAAHCVVDSTTGDALPADDIALADSSAYCADDDRASGGRFAVTSNSPT